MIAQALRDEYLAEMRDRVCSHCVERPPGGPPCGPLGKRCGIEVHLDEIVTLAHTATRSCMDPYIDHLHDDVCAFCAASNTRDCPCPLNYLLPLALEAVEAVEARRAPIV